jgi:hypothetical protein
LGCVYLNLPLLRYHIFDYRCIPVLRSFVIPA